MVESERALQLWQRCSALLLSRLAVIGQKVVHTQHPLHVWVLQHACMQLQPLNADYYVTAQVWQLLQQILSKFTQAQHVCHIMSHRNTLCLPMRHSTDKFLPRE